VRFLYRFGCPRESDSIQAVALGYSASVANADSQRGLALSANDGIGIASLDSARAV